MYNQRKESRTIKKILNNERCQKKEDVRKTKRECIEFYLFSVSMNNAIVFKKVFTFKLLFYNNNRFFEFWVRKNSV